MKGCLACFGTTSAMSIVAGLCMSASTDGGIGSGSSKSTVRDRDGKLQTGSGDKKFGHDADKGTTGGGHTKSKANSAS